MISIPKWLPLRGLVAAASMWLYAPVCALETFHEFSAGFRYQDNVGLAEDERDQISDVVYSLAATLGANVPIDEISGVTFRGTLRGDRHSDLDDLSRFAATLAVRYQLQPHEGFNAPWYSLDSEVSLIEYADSDIRDSYLWSVGATVGMRITDRIDTRTGYRYENRNAHSGNIYELTGHSGFFDVDYVLNPWTTLYAGYTLRRGGIVSTGSFSAKIIAGSRAFASDPAFEREISAWRLNATTHGLVGGINYAISNDTVVDLSSRYFKACGNLDNDYHSLVVGVDIFYQF